MMNMCASGRFVPLRHVLECITLFRVCSVEPSFRMSIVQLYVIFFVVSVYQSQGSHNYDSFLLPFPAIIAFGTVQDPAQRVCGGVPHDRRVVCTLCCAHCECLGALVFGYHDGSCDCAAVRGGCADAEWQLGTLIHSTFHSVI